MNSSCGWVDKSSQLRDEELGAFLELFTPEVPEARHRDLKSYFGKLYDTTLNTWYIMAKISDEATENQIKSPILQQLKEIASMREEAVSALDDAVKALTALEKSDNMPLMLFEENLSKNNRFPHRTETLKEQTSRMATEMVFLSGYLHQVEIETPKGKPLDIITRNFIIQLANLWVEFTGERPKRHFNEVETGPFFNLCQTFMQRLEGAIPKELRKYIPQSTRLDYHVRTVLKEFKDAEA